LGVGAQGLGVCVLDSGSRVLVSVVWGSGRRPGEEADLADVSRSLRVLVTPGGEHSRLALPNPPPDHLQRENLY
jgi:hypothetical protein